MANNRSTRKFCLFVGISFKLFCFLPLAKLCGWEIYVFDISARQIQFTLLQKLHKLGWITRVTEHNSMPFHHTHSDAIELAKNIIDKDSNNKAISLTKILCDNTETDLVFKRVLADHLRLLTAINRYIINNVKIEKPILFISSKYNRIIKENPRILDPSILIKYTLNLEIIMLEMLWLNLTFGYLLHLLFQALCKNSKSKRVFSYAVSVPFPWAAKFKGAREFTFLINDKNIRKDDVVFLVEYKESREFYEHYALLGYFLDEARNISKFKDLFKASTLKIKDFPIVVSLLFCSKRDFFFYEALISLLTSRISWAIITKKTIFRNYIYFNKEGQSQISTNIFFKSQGIKTHAYSQFIGGMYQVCGKKSIFDKRNVHWSFLNPDYYYLNNQAMVDSMALHSQRAVCYKNIGNIFSEKILEIKRSKAHVEDLKKRYGIAKLSKIIAIFDTTYVQLKGLYSTYDEAKFFLEDMIKIAKSLPNSRFLFKPSKNDEHYLTRKRYWANEAGIEIVRLRHEFAKLSNTIMLNDFDDVIDVISVSDIVLTNCFSSPTADALLANIPAFWYQAKTDVSFSDYNKISNLIIIGYAELFAHIDKIFKNGYPLTFLNNPNFNYLVGNKNQKALTDLRLSILNV